MKQITIIQSFTGWVDLYETPVFTEDKKYCFLRLPSPQSTQKGDFEHIAMISVRVCFFDWYFEPIIELFYPFIQNEEPVKYVTRGLFDTTQILQYDPKHDLL